MYKGSVLITTSQLRNICCSEIAIALSVVLVSTVSPLSATRSVANCGIQITLFRFLASICQDISTLPWVRQCLSRWCPCKHGRNIIRSSFLSTNTTVHTLEYLLSGMSPFELCEPNAAVVLDYSKEVDEMKFL